MYLSIILKREYMLDLIDKIAVFESVEEAKKDLLSHINWTNPDLTPFYSHYEELGLYRGTFYQRYQYEHSILKSTISDMKTGTILYTRSTNNVEPINNEKR